MAEDALPRPTATARDHRDRAEPDRAAARRSVAHAGARRPRRVHGRNRARRAPPAQPAPPPPAPQQGVLPIVTDQFATVTVVPNEEIRRAGRRPRSAICCSPSRASPARASRPAPPAGRSSAGLDVNRVGIVENGIGGGGASDLGEDHFVPIDPLATNQVEVIRGPAALRYGSTSIGGVVSATNNRIPGRAADLRGRAVPELRHCRSRRRSRRAVTGLRDGRDADRGRARSIAASKAASCSMPAAAISPFMPTPMAARPATTASRAIRICSTRPGRSTAASRIRRRSRTAPRSAAPTSSTAASSARRSRRTTRSTTSPASTAPITRPGSTRTRPSSPPRANTGPMRRRSTPSGSGPAPPTIKHNEIGLADPADPSTRRRAADLHQQGAGRPRSKCS